MRKIQHLSLGFMIASLLSVNSLFAQEDDTSLRPMPINSVSETSVDFFDLDTEIARLEAKLMQLSQENDQLREENDRLRGVSEVASGEDNYDLEEITHEDSEMDSSRPSNEVDIVPMEDTQEADDIIIQPTSQERTPITIDEGASEILPNETDIAYYQMLINESILPYEVEQAQELQVILQDVEKLISSDKEQALTLWQEFLQMLNDADELIDLHLMLYSTILATVERQADIYLLHQPLVEFRNEVSAARVARYDQQLTQAVDHLQNAQNLWQAIEVDGSLMDLLDKHLEAAISIELLSRRYARGENEQFSKPTSWDAQKAEDNEINAQDMAPEFANLQQAIMLWERATFSAEEGNYDQALTYLSDAGQLITLYSHHSFNRIHTVRLNINRRESLWRIAEEIYGDGFQWRRIWEANQDVIRNPDLIYPGQELGIPEENQVITIAATIDTVTKDDSVVITDDYDQTTNLEEEQLSIDALLDAMSDAEELDTEIIITEDDDSDTEILFIDEEILE